MKICISPEKIKNDIIYYIFIFWYSTELIFNSTIEKIGFIDKSTLNSLSAYIVFVLLLIQIVFIQKYNHRELITIILITLPIIIASYNSGNFTLMSCWMFVVAARNIDIERVIRSAYKIIIICSTIIFLLRFAGIIEDYMMYRNDRIRYSLGFSHPNQLGLTIFQFCACYYYIHRKSFKFKDYFVLTMLMIFVYAVPNSQTSYIAIFMLLLLIFIKGIIDYYQKNTMKNISFLMILCSVFFNVFSAVFLFVDIKKFNFLSIINTLMSDRFSCGHIVYNIYGVSIWGQRIYVSADERAVIGLKIRLWLDNAYMAMILRYGVIVYIIFSILYIYNMIYFWKRNKYELVIILFTYSVYGLMENGWYSMARNIFVITMSYALYSRDIDFENIRNKIGIRVKLRKDNKLVI